MNNTTNDGDVWQLYWRADTGAYAPEAVLELCEVDWRRIRVDSANGSHDTDELFVKHSPLRQLPVLILPDASGMTESVAMMLYLADSHPRSGLLPDAGDPDRAQVYRWLMFLATNVYETCLRIYYSDRYTSDPDHAETVRARAHEQLDKQWDIVEASLRDATMPRADGLSLVDLYIHMLQSWHPDNPALRQRCPEVARVSANTHSHPVIAQVDRLHPLLMKTLA